MLVWSCFTTVGPNTVVIVVHVPVSGSILPDERDGCSGDHRPCLERHSHQRGICADVGRASDEVEIPCSWSTAVAPGVHGIVAARGVAHRRGRAVVLHRQQVRGDVREVRGVVQGVELRVGRERVGGEHEGEHGAAHGGRVGSCCSLLPRALPIARCSARRGAGAGRARRKNSSQLYTSTGSLL